MRLPFRRHWNLGVSGTQTAPYGLHVARQHLIGPRADNPIEAVMAAHVAGPTG